MTPDTPEAPNLPSPDDSKARIEVGLGNLHVEVEGDDLEDVEETFERRWKATLEDAEEMSQAVRDGLQGWH